MIETRMGSDGGGAAPPRTRRIPRPLLLAGTVIPVAFLLFSCSGCSPVYLAKVGWAEMKILRGRRPFDEVINDPRTDEDTRRKLLLARQARAFAIHQLGLDAGDSYTSFTRLETDTLAWVLSAAYKDRLEFKTWWFPIVGRVPYKGYAGRRSAEKAQARLEQDGFDTYLRITSAFSTLGWFADPLLSSILRYDEVDLVETILHELSHNHLFVSGQVLFNESFATFVGRTGAIRFFCGPEGTPQNPPECQAARKRWEDDKAFSAFLDGFVEELRAAYRTPGASLEEKILARDELFRGYQERYRNADPGQVSPLVLGFLGRPLNNAVLLARMLYYHRLSDFQRFLDQHDGDLQAAVSSLARAVDTVEDPFDLLPSGP